MRSVIILKPLIFIARVAYLASYHFSQILEKLGKKPTWVEELSNYFQASPQEVIKQYQKKRPIAAKLWNKKERSTEAQIHSFYKETDYYIYHQNNFNHHKSFFDIAVPLYFQKIGYFCEYGCGVAPVTNWLIKKFPTWQYTLVDLPCPTFKYTKWKFKDKKNVNFSVVTTKKLPLKEKFDVIVCKQVLEHVSKPLTIVKHQVQHLKPGGWLYLDFINAPRDENLESSAQQRGKVLQYLKRKMIPIFTINPNNPAEGYGLYIKPYDK